MKIFITGGAGFIGLHLSNLLLKNKFHVAIYDNRLNFIDNPAYYNTVLAMRAKISNLVPHMDIREDIRNYDSLVSAINRFSPDVIVHLAGLSMARVADHHAHEMQPINMIGTLNVLRAFEHSTSAKKIIYTSSSMAYGHFTQNPQPEDTILNPINDYGACKAAGEYFVKLSKKEWVIIRPTSVYGFTDCANRVTQRIFDAALQGKKAWVVRGESLDFSYIDDVVMGFYLAIIKHSASRQTFNISRGESRQASEFAEIVKNFFPSLMYDVIEPTNQQVYRGALDCSKAKILLGYSPKYSIEDGINQIVKLMKKYRWKQPTT